jgi:hypothetical protein
VLSATCAQSLMIVNFPCRQCSVNFEDNILMVRKTYNYTILPNDNMISNRRGFDDSIGTNMNIVPNFHWVVIEISAICLVWWSGVL